MKKTFYLPVLLMVIFALSRLPGCLPNNFSAAYAFMFCAGVYFPGRLAWWLPLSTMFATDLGINLYYQMALGYPVFDTTLIWYLGVNYVAYIVLIWLGRRFRPQGSFLSLLGGGVMGAIFFYLITNTAAWLFNPFHNPEYSRDFLGWLIALTKGTDGHPQTWDFFRNTMISGGLFTALFIGAMKVNEVPKANADRRKQDVVEVGGAQKVEA
jgi:hypothetical protein